MRALGGAEVDARAVGLGSEGLHAEVAGLELASDVVAAEAAPHDEVVGADENAAILAGAAAGTALQAVEL